MHKAAILWHNIAALLCFNITIPEISMLAAPDELPVNKIQGEG